MVSQKVICDRCGTECNGGSYRISPEIMDDRLRMAIVFGHGEAGMTWDNHFCGKQCLMLAINEMVDGLAAAGVNRHSREGGNPEAEEMEDYYEDNIAA